MTSGSTFDAYNQTELYQACIEAGIKALPTEPRERLISYLEGEAFPDPQTVHEWDRWRHGLMGFILEWWVKIEPQLKCPARSKDPRACFQCLDAQVSYCVVTNKRLEKYIRIHLPKGEQT